MKTPPDAVTLDALVDSDGPDGVLHRTDLIVRTARTVYLAERPGLRAH